MKQQSNLSGEQVVKRAKAAVKIELEKKRAMDLPITVYDRKNKKIYQINSDGSREVLGDRLTKGWYSERKKA